MTDRLTDGPGSVAAGSRTSGGRRLRAMKCTPAWPYSRLHPGVSQHSRGGCENWRMPSNAAGVVPKGRKRPHNFAQTCTSCLCNVEAGLDSSPHPSPKRTTCPYSLASLHDPRR